MIYSMKFQLGPQVKHGPSRHLGAFEKLFWLADRNRPNQFAIAAEISGTASNEAWQLAVTAMVRKDPSVLSAIVPDQHGEPTFLGGVASRLPVHFVEAPTSVWPLHLARHMAQPFLAAEAPLLRITVIQDAERAAVILSAHHAIADGKSLVYWLRDLLRHISGVAVTRSPGTRSIESLVTQTLGPLSHAELDAPGRDIRTRNLDGRPPTIATASLSAEQTSQLRDAAKSRSTSIHGILCAAFGEALRETKGPQTPVRIVSPVDLRQRVLGGSEQLGMYLSGLRLVDDDPGMDFWLRAQRNSDAFDIFNFADGIRTAVGTLDHHVASLKTSAKAIDLLARTFAADILMTNMGAVAIPSDYGAMTLEAIWGPSVTLGFEGEQTIGTSSFGGRLRLLHTSYAPVAGLLAAAVDRIIWETS